ncbi:phosphoenolpyruvate carboxykinase (ATP) [Filimonas lacunae]|uniref:Phosphoenolpyruvate carboxykinase (ATP) n=1 Tax=Filimonas lacunae TaxID=477680 RepID=A0A173MLP4_9BACT|nr:phosphoenolpyruvate carboxykinase (ATP) [Filimonas lacunae]BAV08563.1 phosphoenolpyruvate carboxykinase [ATP] [Filimonas lacunae]SIS57214.1 phosphoenolpyruvate carboxykinase (ATP) [Filimonas lacunae]
MSSIITIAAPAVPLTEMGISCPVIHYQLSPYELVDQALQNHEGVLNDTGALCINTGEFTGRSPKDKFIVKDALTAETVNWNNFNQPISAASFLQLKKEMLIYLNKKQEVWVRDCYACATPAFRLSLRVVTETASANLFAYNMFLRPEEEDIDFFKPEWQIIHAPGFTATAAVHGTNQHNFAIISFTDKTILIGGTGYTGEMKKGVFTVLNYLLPQNKHTLSMHCSANVGKAGDVALFFGLSGTGKTTLSADPSRSLIGDDEHGWNHNHVFNFEGGCYAKCIDLDVEKEPDIFHAIRNGALLENIVFKPGSQQVNFADKTITENTRVSYPLHYIPGSVEPSIGTIPKNIFFLTCDAYGVLPPISRLTPEQAMYQYISGYTARVAGTEAGVTEPKSTFSACFGAPFIPLHPAQYAAMLGQKLKDHKVNVWLINTGWTGGPYGVGKRMQLKYTRAMITAALKGDLDRVTFEKHPIFGIAIPSSCPGVPTELLNPRSTWPDVAAYDAAAQKLAIAFNDNFKQYADRVSPEILAAAPLAF